MVDLIISGPKIAAGKLRHDPDFMHREVVQLMIRGGQYFQRQRSELLWGDARFVRIALSPGTPDTRIGMNVPTSHDTMFVEGHHGWFQLQGYSGDGTSHGLCRQSYPYPPWMGFLADTITRIRMMHVVVSGGHCKGEWKHHFKAQAGIRKSISSLSSNISAG